MENNDEDEITKQKANTDSSSITWRMTEAAIKKIEIECLRSQNITTLNSRRGPIFTPKKLPTIMYNRLPSAKYVQIGNMNDKSTFSQAQWCPDRLQSQRNDMYICMNTNVRSLSESSRPISCISSLPPCLRNAQLKKEKKKPRDKKLFAFPFNPNANIAQAAALRNAHRKEEILISHHQPLTRLRRISSHRSFSQYLAKQNLSLALRSRSANRF